jgi:integrase
MTTPSRAGLIMPIISARGSMPGSSTKWVTGIGLRKEDYGTHSLRRTKASIIYKQTGNLRAVQILLGHTKIESTVRYLGVDIEDALALAEGTEV